QQIIQNNLRLNNKNIEEKKLPKQTVPVNAMDPTRPQNDTPDPSIHYGEASNVPYCASYNAELFKQLTPRMEQVLRNRV
ncbi:MAG: hypothetical protein ACP5D0_00925, partial [Hydrogenovibrio sp.]